MIPLSQRIALEINRIWRYNQAKLHPLRQLFWEVTLCCNASCRHCGSDCSSIDTSDPKRSLSHNTEMPLEDFLKVLDEEITPHVDTYRTMIILSGGEPLMRKDIENIGLSLHNRKYPWGLVTNGIALTEEKFSSLRKCGLTSMTISLDGTEEDHIWMRRNPLAFEGACRAIRLCADDPSITWDVVTCVTPRMLPKLNEIQQFLWSMGCRLWRVVNVDPMGRGGLKEQTPADGLLLNETEFRQMLDFIALQRQQGRHVSYGCAGFVGDYEGKVRDYLYRCAAGIEVASILCDGSISACTSIRGQYYQGNIYRDKFWDVWENRFQPYRDRKWMHQQYPCDRCKVWRYCLGNGLHLRTREGELMVCHYNALHNKPLYP